MNPDAEPVSDLALLQNWKRGDLKAADALLERHFSCLLRFFRNKASGAVEDLVQETLLECVRSHERFREGSNFRTFLLGIANNVLRRYYRRISRGPAEVDFSSSSVAVLDPSPSTIVRQTEQQQLLLSALRNIPLDGQVLLELQFWEELSSSEIGQILDIPAATVRTRLRKAKGLLLEQVESLAVNVDVCSSTLAEFDTWVHEIRGWLGGEGS